MSKRRLVTLMIHRDGDVESRTYRMPLWLVRTGLITGSVVAVLVVLGAVLYTPIARTAASVPGLKRELARLRAENRQVTELARTLAEVESRYEQVRSMLGGDVVPARRYLGLERLAVANALFARAPSGPPRYEIGPSVPHHWPLDVRGVITRGQVSPGAADETHPGMDVAVPRGTPIRASGGGVVIEIGEDAEYGIFTIINHPDGYESLYGHASRLLVRRGDSVGAGQVIALSGSTGRSTGPHLHFEIRRSGRSIDPSSVVREES